MKVLALVSLLSFASVFGEATIKDDKIYEEDFGIEFFEGTWREVLEKAKKEDKLVFLDAYASWCGPCKAMQKKVFPTQKVGEYFNANFVSVKIDMEKGEGPVLSEKYGVRAYPSLFFIDHDGRVVKSAIGYHNVNSLLKLGGEALN